MPGKEQKQEESNSPGSLMVLPKGKYRKIAQRNWNLTDEQMEGMHVHHRILVSEGGTNDPANLFVCSPSCHAVWHEQNLHPNLLEKAKQGGHTQGKINVENGHLQKISHLGGKKCSELGVGAHDPEARRRGAKKAGLRNTPKQREARERTGKLWGEYYFTSVTLLHIETGKKYFFEKCKDACEALNLNPSCLSLVMHGHRKHHKGYTVLHFERQNKGK